jgi:fucose permease
VRDQSYPYSTTGKITVLYILIFSFYRTTVKYKARTVRLKERKTEMKTAEWWHLQHEFMACYVGNKYTVLCSYVSACIRLKLV